METGARGACLDGKQDIDGANDVVVLGEDSTVAVDHGVGGAALLSKVDHGIRQEILQSD